MEVSQALEEASLVDVIPSGFLNTLPAAGSIDGTGVAFWDAAFLLDPTPAAMGVSFFVACTLTTLVFFSLLLLRQESVTMTVHLNMAILVAVSFFFIYTKSLIIMFVSFECLLFISLNILRITSKSERIGEAVSEMFM
jgi:hypothetical protein